MMVAANKCDLLEPDSDNLQRLRDHVAALGCDFYEFLRLRPWEPAT